MPSLKKVTVTVLFDWCVCGHLKGSHGAHSCRGCRGEGGEYSCGGFRQAITVVTRQGNAIILRHQVIDINDY